MDCIVEHSGYVINVKSLLRDHPGEWKIIREFYPNAKYKDETDYQCYWQFPGDQLFVELQIFVESEICEGSLIDVTGNWYGDFLDSWEGIECPFEDDEAYVVFEEKRIDEVKVFMRQHNIPERMLKHRKWRCNE